MKNSIYNTKPDQSGAQKEEPSIYNTAPNNKGVYGKMMEGYVPVPKAAKSNELQLLKHGNVVEITLNDKKFAIHDPVRIEGIINLVEKHEESLVMLRQSNRTLTAKVQELINKVNNLKGEVQTLKEKLNGQNNYNSNL